MKYITQKGLNEIRQAVEQAYTDIADTVELPTLSMLALLQGLDLIVDCDFDTVHEAGKRLRKIVERDFPVRQRFTPVNPGSEDYVIRAVVEALFGKD